MKRMWFVRAGAGLLLCLGVLSLFFLSPAGRAVQAFNQQNLVRVTEVREVDGQVYYRRLAPATGLLP